MLLFVFLILHIVENVTNSIFHESCYNISFTQQKCKSYALKHINLNSPILTCLVI